MIQLLNNLIELGIEYLKLKNQSFIFDKNAHLLIGLFPSIVETDSDIASALSWIF